MHNKFDRIFSAIVICILLLLLICGIFFLNNTYILNISSTNMPLLYIASQSPLYIYIIYSLTIGLSIYTTAVSTGYTVISKYEKNKKVLQFLSFVICTLGIIVSNIDFSTLIEYCFSWIGYIGIIEIYLIIKKGRKIKKQKQ